MTVSNIYRNIMQAADTIKRRMLYVVSFKQLCFQQITHKSIDNSKNGRIT